MNPRVEDCRDDFPALQSVKKPVYLDSAATTLRPQIVVEAVRWYMEEATAAVHRGVHQQSFEVTERFEATRSALAGWIGSDADEIVFTSGATAAINLVRYGLKGLARAVVTIMEHHSNLVPWMNLEGFRTIAVDPGGAIDRDALTRSLQEGVDLVAVTHMSNVLGCVTPIAELTKLAHQHGAKILVDAAQSASHHRINVRRLDLDFLVCSAHKMLGPAGAGALFINRRNHDAMQPVILGGNMVDRVRRDGWDPLPPPHCFEAGSPPAESVIGWGAAIEYLEGFGPEHIDAHLRELTQYLLAELQTLDGARVLGPSEAGTRGPLVSFVIEGLESHTVAKVLNRRDNIIVRSGFHCAEPLHVHLGVAPSLRVSLQLYNDRSDVERLIRVLRNLSSLRAR